MRRAAGALLALAGLLAGCGGGGQSRGTAPIEVIELGDTGPGIELDTGPVERPGHHAVAAGETLGEIALRYGMDYSEIALWNGIANPNLIEVGQRLRLSPPPDMPEVTPLAEAAEVTPLALAEPPQPVALAAPGGEAPAEPAAPAATASAAAEPARPAQVTRAQIGIGQDGAAAPGGEVSQPQALLLPYSDAAYRRLLAEAGGAQHASLVIPQRQDGIAPQSTRERSGLVWSWPTSGKVVENFSTGSKGIRIAGPQGWPIFASADGRVIYAGTGLKGYGQMVVIKHANEYLTTYAHNHRILVAEGEEVRRGQQIAEMGKSGAEAVGLHFAVRRGSDTLNPRQFLPRNP